MSCTGRGDVATSASVGLCSWLGDGNLSVLSAIHRLGSDRTGNDKPVMGASGCTLKPYCSPMPRALRLSWGVSGGGTGFNTRTQTLSENLVCPAEDETPSMRERWRFRGMKRAMHRKWRPQSSKSGAFGKWRVSCTWRGYTSHVVRCTLPTPMIVCR